MRNTGPLQDIWKKISNEISFQLQKEMASLAGRHSSVLKRGIRYRILQGTSAWESMKSSQLIQG
ncbi:MAG: hypothetical protein C4526_12620 [Nitrospiraceae bacterium]|nr:MAG: hypothetical protein C4526_12620 [Nitrospiraceae bacterium]